MRGAFFSGTYTFGRRPRRRRLSHCRKSKSRRIRKSVFGIDNNITPFLRDPYNNGISARNTCINIKRRTRNADLFGGTTRCVCVYNNNNNNNNMWFSPNSRPHAKRRRSLEFHGPNSDAQNWVLTMLLLQLLLHRCGRNYRAGKTKKKKKFEKNLITRRKLSLSFWNSDSRYASLYYIVCARINSCTWPADSLWTGF